MTTTNILIKKVNEIYDEVKSLPDTFWNKQTINENRYECQNCLSQINDVSRMLSDAKRGQYE